MTLFPAFTRLLRTFRPAATRPTNDDLRAVHKIRELAVLHADRDERALRDEFELLREVVRAGRSPECPTVMVPAMALACVAVQRTIGVTLYNVQLLAGLALARRSIAEMHTGEGKTLVAALPAILHALAGRGVHVLTVNSYLAQRDFEKLQPVLNCLGISAGLLPARGSQQEKRAAYACDVTYGPGYEFGFDYLRDQTALHARKAPRLGESYLHTQDSATRAETELVQRGFAFAVIDEADSVLLDEASTPLVLSSGPAAAAPNAQVFVLAERLARELQAERDYRLDATASTLSLCPAGTAKIHNYAKEAVRYGLQRPWADYVEKALRARFLLRRDADYIVSDGRVDIVDQNTGRVFADRSWRDGLHQAVQAKEGVPIQAEQLPVARISRQRFFRLYDGLCGLTGTAAGSERELLETYRLPVVAIPRNRPSQRIALPTRWFASRQAKLAAAVAEIQRVHVTGQPILVGARTIAETETLADALKSGNTPFTLLNGKQDADEAATVELAGQIGSVTLATNMAGRGTDIRLGPGSSERGGLYVLGLEQYESQRVDRQLLGRAGRQGDPGVCRFLVSADDSLLRCHAPGLARRLKQSANASGEVFGDYSAAVTRAQTKAESEQVARRRQLMAHDSWLEGVLLSLAGQEE